MMDILTNIILSLLTIDTIRAIIAMMGWVKPDTKYAWLIYGRYERNLILTGLKEIGFKQRKSEEIVKNLQKTANTAQGGYGITPDNAAEQLIILIAKYIVHFDGPKQYGGRKTTDSSYYIDTMEMAHDEKDKQRMVAIMTRLYAHCGSREKPQIIVTPKGGNPLFALEVANYYSANFIIAKGKDDKSKISSPVYDPSVDFQINYEGSWHVMSAESRQTSIIVDCNTSGGSQLIDTITGIKGISESVPESKIQAPTDVYVLFRADDGRGHDIDIDQKFRDHGCTLHRFFDLDEEIKERIYKLKMNAGADCVPDLYVARDRQQVEAILQLMQKKKTLFYSPKKVSETQDKTPTQGDRRTTGQAVEKNADTNQQTDSRTDI